MPHPFPFPPASHLQRPVAVFENKPPAGNSVYDLLSVCRPCPFLACSRPFAGPYLYPAPRKVLEMPHCYFVNDYRQSERVVVDSPTPDRADHGLSPLQLLPAELPVDDDYADARAAAAAAAAAGLFADEGREIRKGYQTGRRAGDGGGGGITSGAVAGRRGHERGGTAEEVLERRRREGKECGRVVLCNFNRLHKLDPHTFGAWMKVRAFMGGNSREVYR